MRIAVYKKLVCTVVLLFLLPSFVRSEPNSIPTEPRQAKAARIICTGMIDDGLYQSIKRRTETALAEGVDYLIYEIETYGGMVQAADDIAKYFILDVGKKAHTIAYVRTEAISAGAMISVSCRDIIMRENTTIGDCAPITMGGKLEGVEREKAESFIRAVFDRAAEANQYPPALLRAMVSMQLEVWRVENKTSGGYQFFEKEKLPTDANEWALDEKELIVRDDQILTLTAKKAKEYGIASVVVNDVNEALTFLAERDNVRFAGTTKVYEPNWSEQMVRLVNSPAVMSVLVLLALLGVYMEFNTPGLGLPGLVAVICFVVIVGSKYLTGMANWVEVAAFVIGIILLMVEFFVLPGFGIAGALGLIFLIGGLVGMLVKTSPGELPIPRSEFDWQLFTDGALGLLIGFGLFLVAAWILAKYMPRLGAFAGFSLIPSSAKKGDEVEVSMTVAPDSPVRMINVGDRGETITKLRPSGRAKFGEAIVDVVCRAEFLDNNTPVEIIEIRGNRVMVRKIDGQND